MLHRRLRCKLNPRVFIVDDGKPILEVCKKIFDLNEIDLADTVENEMKRLGRSKR